MFIEFSPDSDSLFFTSKNSYFLLTLFPLWQWLFIHFRLTTSFRYDSLFYSAQESNLWSHSADNIWFDFFPSINGFIIGKQLFLQIKQSFLRSPETKTVFGSKNNNRVHMLQVLQIWMIKFVPTSKLTYSELFGYISRILSLKKHNLIICKMI